MKTANLKHKMTIKATPVAVYNALMDSKIHADITKMKAEIDKKAGGYFIECDGHHYGYNLVLQPGKRIIQSWGNRDFPGQHQSIVDFKFEKDGDVTNVTFHQYAAPKDAISWLKSGWKKHYWEPLAAYFDEKNKTPVKKAITPKKPIKKAANKKPVAKKAVVASRRK